MVFGGFAIKLVIVPETRLGSVTNCDHGWGSKEEAVILIIGGVQSMPMVWTHQSSPAKATKDEELFQISLCQVFLACLSFLA